MRTRDRGVVRPAFFNQPLRLGMLGQSSKQAKIQEIVKKRRKKASFPVEVRLDPRAVHVFVAAATRLFKSIIGTRYLAFTQCV